MFPTTSLALGYWDLSATSSWRVVGWIHITRSPLKHTCFCSLLFWVCRKRMQKEFRPYMKPRIPYMKPKILPSDWWGPVAPTSGWQLAILHPFLCCHWLKSPTPTEVFLSLWKCYSKKQTNKQKTGWKMERTNLWCKPVGLYSCYTKWRKVGAFRKLSSSDIHSVISCISYLPFHSINVSQGH